MASPTSLITVSGPYTPTATDLAGPRAGRGPSVLALEPARPLYDALQAPQPPVQRAPRKSHEEQGRGAARQASTQIGGRGARGNAALPPQQTPENQQARAQAGAEFRSAPRAVHSAPFLVQLFGQDQPRSRIVANQHRDAATQGSDAYRRAGATPPIYSEEATLFRVAI